MQEESESESEFALTAYVSLFIHEEQFSEPD